MLGALQAKQKLNLRSIGLLITSFTVLIVLGRAIVGEIGLVAVLNVAWTPEALGAFLFALPLVGYATVGLGVAVFVYYGFRTHFQVDRFAVKKQFKKTFVIASLVFCGLFLSSLVTAPLVSANATATTGYYLATPYSPYDWLVGKYSTGACYAINGSNWANLMTFPATTWAAYADNASKVQELVLAATTAGTVYLKEVAFDYDCTIPANVQVIENVNGLTRTFVDDSESQGSPYTVSVDTVNPTYYTVQDCADRYIISWTSTNKTSVLANVASSASVKSTVDIGLGVVGSGKASCIVGNASEALSAGNLVYYNPTTSQYTKADADANSTVGYGYVWLAVIDASANGKCLLLDNGIFELSTWTWTANDNLWVGTDSGAIVASYPTGTGDQLVNVGITHSSTEIKFQNPNGEYDEHV